MRILETEDEAKERRRVKAKEWDVERWAEQRESLLDGAERQQHLAETVASRTRRMREAKRIARSERFRKH